MPLAGSVRKELVVLNTIEELRTRLDRYREEVEEFNRRKEEWENQREEVPVAA